MKVIQHIYFDHQINKLKKDFPKIRYDLDNFLETITIDQGQFLGSGLYKFRLKNSSIPTGKRDGFRLIVYINTQKETALPICIYSKSHKPNIDKDEIKQHFDHSIQSLTS